MVKDLRGQRFGSVVVETHYGRVNGKTAWKCKCDCGNEVILTYDQLHYKKHPSCGCVKLKLVRPNRVYEKKHGMTNTRLYSLWRQMKHRCSTKDKNSNLYKWYAERGIKVCDEWQEFLPFYEWAMANGYDENAPRGQCTLDRIDVNGDYEPSNCRWITNTQQQWNKRDTVYLEYKGETKPLAEWCELLGVNRHSCYNRMHQQGITDARTILFGR